MSYSPDDLALALDTLIERATDDIPFVSGDRAGYERACNQAIARTRARIAPLARLIGLNLDGDPTLGDKTNAAAIVTDLQSYEKDPNAFIERTLGTAQSAETIQVAPEDHNADTPPPAAPQLVTQPVAPPAAITKAPALTLVERPASSLFKGISPTFASELVPCPRWQDTPPAMKKPDPDYAFEGLPIKIMATAIRKRRNVMVTGEPGCGKTEFFKQFGATIGLPVHKIPFDGSMTRSDLIGSFRQIATETGSATPFYDGLIPKLIQQPCLLILDEIDQADPDIQYLMHPVYEGEGLTILEDGGRYVPRHEHCYIVATANTKGRGSDTGLTHARFEMSEATRDRFSYWLDFTYLKSDRESATITAKTGLHAAEATKLVEIATNIRDGYRAGMIAQPCSLRQLLDVAELAQDNVTLGADIALALACDIVLAGRANPDDKTAIRNFVRTTLAVDLETMDLA